MQKYFQSNKREQVVSIEYRNKGETITKCWFSRAQGIKPYNTQTEEAFLANLNYDLDNMLNTSKK